MKQLFSIPDGLSVRPLNRALLSALEQHKEWFYDDFIIETAFGSPPGCVWNGNRLELIFALGEKKTQVFFIDEVDWSRQVAAMYKSAGIKYRLTFTNFMLRPYHLFNTYANNVAAVFNEVGAYVMVSIPLMAEYMSRKYPNLTICWSTTTNFEKGIDTVNELSAHSLVVAPYEYNNTPNIDLLTHPGNIEILINEKCIDDCPRRREHWSLINRCNTLEELVNSDCFFADAVNNSDTPRKRTVTKAQLPAYLEKGINHFKIEGRDNYKRVMAAYQHYFILPEYVQDFVGYAQNSHWVNETMAEMPGWELVGIGDK